METKIDIARDTKFVVSSTAAEIIALGAKKHHIFRVVGFGPIPDSPFLMGLWRVEPHSEPPIIAKQRIDLIRAAGYEIKGYVVIHEPKIVEPAPVVAQPQKKDNAAPIISTVDFSGVLVMGLVLIGSLFISAILSDPSIVVVCGPENVWIEVVNYYE
jgi:hypothetical protein